jgi:hypothetical protein
MLPPLPVPVTLRAPRYAHLMQEAAAISKMGAPSAPVLPEADFAEDMQPVPAPAPAPPPTLSAATSRTDASTPGLGKRVKGFFWSYLSNLKEAPPPPKPKAPDQPALPLPPREAYSKARPEKLTPARPPPERAPHPKELVDLHPAPAPAPAGSTRRDPRRLVDLRPVASPLQAPPAPIDIPRARRSSGASVKDLVRSFEAMEDFHALLQDEASRTVSLRRMRSQSGDSLKSKGTAAETRAKPVWKP